MISVTGALRTVAAGLLSDLVRRPPHSALWRAVRRSMGVARGNRELLSNAAYRRHIALVDDRDPLFFLSHRYYLARGFTIRQRASAAQHHYRHETTAFDQDYFHAVYHGQGLLLWQAETPGGYFDIRLQPGNNVLHEGGMSVAARFNGERICVMSYSTLPTTLLLPGADPGDATIFITRKQLTTNHTYQAVFNKAFDRSTVAHFCFGALSGIALAQGHKRVIAIDADAHPACQDDLRSIFNAAYTEFWRSLQGRSESVFGHTIDLPMRLPPLDNMDAKARKRAEARRRHIDTVRDSAQSAVREHWRPCAVASAAARRRAADGGKVRTMLFFVLMLAA